MAENIDVTLAKLEQTHWPAVREIYLEGIATGSATFETEAPDWEIWDKAHAEHCRLAAVRDGEIIGWAALSPISARRAYAGVAEVSVYVADSARGHGVGLALLDALVNCSERYGIWTLQAGIFAENAASRTLHERCGFREVGTRERVGRLRGVWKDVVLFERRSKLIGTEEVAMPDTHRKIKVGVMGSANDTLPDGVADNVRKLAEALGREIAAHELILLTGATTGVTEIVSRAAREAGGFTLGISPASDENEHVERYKLPVDASDAIIYTGFGLKGRNVVLVRSSDIAIFIGGSMGSLNEFTIAHDEGRILGCLTGTGGIADEAERLLRVLSKKPDVCVLHGDDPGRLLAGCLEAFEQSRPRDN